ncbi:MAG: hypothetical protein A2632_00440 [Candidatus Pacebacteria bacterium RIFCSPHIGHO2_01_FULL_46_16]|nr:MAG: hypothetical protein A2632_00440 [Candidatus Pacebacteria bacterium RIFCSPHIGHO2_01_FULL_46_16]OGJ21078.1 MAG: hypothetical protein A3J60_03660 [Candidatus Pacebacteria bacterium RIFCSPHIGHO2_02_FULL_46_9]OGJ38733.1 MAG: hypothetical protein A3A82_03325 [Candidatus Pacebacteria bacterium RIFCSPLOWO2_01_FULL_47_12]
MPNETEKRTREPQSSSAERTAAIQEFLVVVRGTDPKNEQSLRTAWKWLAENGSKLAANWDEREGYIVGAGKIQKWLNKGTIQLPPSSITLYDAIFLSLVRDAQKSFSQVAQVLTAMLQLAGASEADIAFIQRNVADF